MNKDIFYDLVIIGAGILGCTAATIARQRYPKWRIVLLDRSLVGRGATQYSAGIDIPLGKTHYQRNLVTTSAQFYGNLRIHLPDIPIFPVPLLWFVSQEQQNSFAQQRVGGIPPSANSEAITGLLRMLPTCRLPTAGAIFLEEQASYSFPGCIAERLARAFLETPRSSLWEGVQVDDLVWQEDHIQIHTQAGWAVHAQRALVAIGPWIVHSFGQQLFERMPMRIKKIVAMHVDRQPPTGAPALCFYDDDAYLIPLHTRKQWLFSFTSNEWDVLPEVSRLTISPQDHAVAQNILSRYIPELVEDCIAGRVFCDAYTDDRIPYIDCPQENVPRLVVAGGCSGSGYRLAPGIATEALHRLI